MKSLGWTCCVSTKLSNMIYDIFCQIHGLYTGTQPQLFKKWIHLVLLEEGYDIYE